MKVYKVEVEVVQVVEGFMATPRIFCSPWNTNYPNEFKLPHSVSRDESKAVSYALTDAAMAISNRNIK